MDKSIYVGVNGGQAVMRQLEVLTNNLANINTPGFKADHLAFVPGPNIGQTREYTYLDKSYSDFTPGPTFSTARDLDIAINGRGFIAVQSKEGKEGYTRAGNLTLNGDGTLITSNGDVVIGRSGVIKLPIAEHVQIAIDGTVSVQLPGNTDLTPIDRIKLVNPDTNLLTKGAEGLFYLKGAGSAKADDNVTVMPGVLEGSNVNSIDAMTKLVELSRQYEMNTKFIKTISDNTSKANQLLSAR